MCLLSVSPSLTATVPCGTINIESCISALGGTFSTFSILEHKASVISPFFSFEITKKQNHSQGSSHQIAIQTMVKITVDTIWRLCFSPESVKMGFNSVLTHLQWAKYFPHRTHPTPHRGFFFFFYSVTQRNTKLLVTCMTCSSAPSACWRSPVHFSSRSSLCEEFGKWWGYTAEWRVSQRPLPGWSDRTNWSLALQDRDSQTLSQNRSSKRLKCFHPCLCSCRPSAVFTSSCVGVESGDALANTSTIKQTIKQI